MCAAHFYVYISVYLCVLTAELLLLLVLSSFLGVRTLPGALETLTADAAAAAPALVLFYREHTQANAPGEHHHQHNHAHQKKKGA